MSGCRTIHELPADLVNELTATNEITSLSENLTSIARNKFICWAEGAKQGMTRVRRIKRTVEKLLEGQKRPCCWVGCIYRTDKKRSQWQQDVLTHEKTKVGIKVDLAEGNGFGDSGRYESAVQTHTDARNI